MAFCNSDIIIVQTADAFSEYREMLQLTENVNAAYCARYDLGYSNFIGIKVGVAPWMATYNRIFMLDELVRNGYQGWVAYVDADAFFCDPEFDIRQYLSENSEFAIIGGPGRTNLTWEINAGIFFINLGDPDGRAIVSRWLKLFSEKVPEHYLADASAKWDEFPNDQWLLHEVLKSDEALTRKTKNEAKGIFNYRDGKHIKQAIRASFHDNYDRLEWIRSETSLALGAMSALPYCDLTALANKYGSDKGDAIGNKHGYAQYYQFLLERFRSQKFSFMELGLLRGGPEVGIGAGRAVDDAPSVKMWLDYFPKAYCHGVDISDFSTIKMPRFRFHQADMGKPADLARIKSQVGTMKFIVDDASHASYHQQLAFAAFFQLVERGGYYIIEDLDWQPKAYEATLPTRPLTRHVFELFGRSGRLELPVSRSDCAAIENMIGSVSFLRRRGDGTTKLVAIQRR